MDIASKSEKLSQWGGAFKLFNNQHCFSVFKKTSSVMDIYGKQLSVPSLCDLHKRSPNFMILVVSFNLDWSGFCKLEQERLQ